MKKIVALLIFLFSATNLFAMIEFMVSEHDARWKKLDKKVSRRGSRARPSKALKDFQAQLKFLESAAEPVAKRLEVLGQKIEDATEEEDESEFDGVRHLIKDVCKLKVVGQLEQPDLLLSLLKWIPNLQELYFENVSMPNLDFLQNVVNERVNILSFTVGVLDRLDLARIFSFFPRVSRLAVEGVEIQTFSCSGMPIRPEVTELKLNFNSRSQQDINLESFLANFPSLKDFTLGGDRTRVTFGHPVRDLHGLESLKLINLGGVDLGALSQLFPSLQTLRTYNCSNMDFSRLNIPELYQFIIKDIKNLPGNFDGVLGDLAKRHRSLDLVVAEGCKIAGAREEIDLPFLERAVQAADPVARGRQWIGISLSDGGSRERRELGPKPAGRRHVDVKFKRVRLTASRPQAVSAPASPAAAPGASPGQ